MAFLGNAPVAKNCDASEDLTKAAKDPYNVLKERIVSEIGGEDIGEVLRVILDGILGKVVAKDFSEIVDAKEDLVKLCKEYQEVVGGVVGGIVGGIGGEIGSGIICSGIVDDDISVARGILDGILEKVVTEDLGEIVNAKKNRIKAFLAKFDNSTDIAEFKMIEEDENVKNTNIRYRCILKFKSIEAATNFFSTVKKALTQSEVKKVEDDDFARGIREMQATRKVWRENYRGISANDFPQFHRQIFQQNFEDLVQGEEDLDKIEQEFKEDAKFDLAKWTNECFGNSSARVPLYARGKDTRHKGNLLPPTTGAPRRI